MRRLVLLAVFGLAACSDEPATPVDLSAAATSSTPAGPGGGPASDAGDTGSGSLPATPHAIGENPQARAYAEQQCLSDPTKREGVIRIVDPATNVVVGEVVVACAEVRAGDDGPPPATP